MVNYEALADEAHLPRTFTGLAPASVPPLAIRSIWRDGRGIAAGVFQLTFAPAQPVRPGSVSRSLIWQSPQAGAEAAARRVARSMIQLRGYTGGTAYAAILTAIGAWTAASTAWMSTVTAPAIASSALGAVVLVYARTAGSAPSPQASAPDGASRSAQ